MTKQRMTYLEFLDESPMTPFLWVMLFGVVLAQLFDGLETQANSLTLPGVIAAFKVTPIQAGTIASITSFGLLIGALACSALSDRIGRKALFQTVLGLYTVGAAVSALAPNYDVLLFGRALSGLGIGGEFPVAFALLAEYAPRKYRHRFIMLGPLFYGTGFLVAAGLSIWIIPKFGWRSLFWAGFTPALIILYMRRYLPESVRFLLSQNRLDDARKVMEQIASDARFSDIELVPPGPQEIQSRDGRRAQRKVLLQTSLPALIALGALYFCQFIQSGGIGSWLPTIFVQHGVTLTRTFVFVLITLVGTTVAQPFGAWLEERVPRKYAIMLCSGLGAACFITAGISFQDGSPILFSVIMLALTNFFAQGNIVILYTLGSEMFPTATRSLGMGLVTSMGRVGAILGPLITAVFITLGTQISQIIYYFSLPLLVAAVLGLVLIRIDTRQKTLEVIQIATA